MRSTAGGWRATLLATALIVIGAVACERPPSEVEDGPPSTSNPSQLPGFRADAWFLPDDELLGFVEIPAGQFVMGSDAAIDALAFANERWGDGSAQGTVDLPAFYIGRYEVTVAQFGAFVQATGFTVEARALQAPPDHPVTWISWPDAVAYGRWLESALGQWAQTPRRLSRALDAGWRIELPTEAEWEKAARGPDGRIYPWGKQAGDGAGQLRRHRDGTGGQLPLPGMRLRSVRHERQRLGADAQPVPAIPVRPDR